MSGVRAAASLKAEPRCVPSEDVTAMQDQLYEILATGVAPGASAPIELIEGFLHEHARAPKSLEEFEAFFARCGLTPAPTALPPPREGGFALPPFGDAAPASPVVRFVDEGEPALGADPTLPLRLSAVENDFERPERRRVRARRCFGQRWAPAACW